MLGFSKERSFTYCEMIWITGNPGSPDGAAAPPPLGSLLGSAMRFPIFRRKLKGRGDLEGPAASTDRRSMTSCGLTAVAVKRFTTRNFYDHGVNRPSQLDRGARKV